MVQRESSPLSEQLEASSVTNTKGSKIPGDLYSALLSFPFRGSEGLHTPELGDLEKIYLGACIDSGYVSSVGAFVDRFEQEVSEFTGVEHAVATSSGTTGLHVALVALGVGPGDAVIIPAITFVATANAVRHCGAVPIVLDVENLTMGLDPDALYDFFSSETRSSGDGQIVHGETGLVVKAVIAVHVLGHSSQITRIAEHCAEMGVPLLEDSAESLGTFFEGRHTGRFGIAGVLSFNGNKTITTGGGGCVITDDASFANRLRHLATTGRISHPYEFDHDVVGYNYRMPNINAALGCAQMERLDGVIARQRTLHRHYEDHFADVDTASVISAPEGSDSNFWLQAIRLSNPSLETRNAVLELAVSLQIPMRPLWKPIPMVEAHQRGLSRNTLTARAMYESVICIPSSPSLVAPKTREFGKENG